MTEHIGPRSLRELTRIIFVRFWMVIFIIAIITGGTLVACLRAPKYYRSSVTFLIKEPRPQNPTAQNVSTDRSLEVFIKTQHQLIKSDTVLSRTLAILQDNIAEDEAKSPAVNKWRSARNNWLREETEEAWLEFLQALDALDEHVENLKQDPDFRNKLRKFARGIDVESPGGADVALSEILTVSVVQPDDPVYAKQAADELARNYMDRYRQVQSKYSSNAVTFMRGRLSQLKQQRLQKAEQAVRDFVDNELESPADLVILEQLSKSGTEAGRQIIVRTFREQIITLDGELAETRQLKQQLLEQMPDGLWESGTRLEGRKGELTVPDLSRLDEDKLPDDDPILTDIVTIIPEATLKNNVVIAQLKSKEVGLIIELNRLKVEYNDDYREVRDKLNEISRTRRQILRELIGEAQSLDIKIATLSARQEELSRKLDEELNRLNRITQRLVKYQKLQHEVNLARAEYQKISSELSSAMSFQEQEADAITINIVDEAKLPDKNKPVFPVTGLYTLIAAIVGMFLAVAYAFLADHFDHTLQSIEETERYLGVPVMGSIRRYGNNLLT